MSEAEALKYKRDLVLSHQGEISQAQAEELLCHPARTPAQIDACFEKLLSEFAVQREAAESLWLQERNAAAASARARSGSESP